MWDVFRLSESSQWYVRTGWTTGIEAHVCGTCLDCLSRPSGTLGRDGHPGLRPMCVGRVKTV